MAIASRVRGRSTTDAQAGRKSPVSTGPTIIAIPATIALCAIVSGALPGCQSTACDGDAMGQQQTKLLDTQRVDDKSYYLYTRTTGFQEKVIFFELYDQQPEFDNCEQSSVRPVFEVDYNDYPTEQHVKTITLQADAAEKLLIVYTTNKNEGFPNVNEVRFAR